MHRSITPKPFEFTADFSAPPQEQPGRADLSTEELAFLLAQARAEGAASARSDQTAEDAGRLSAASAAFTDALETLSDLMQALDVAAENQAGANAVKSLIRAAAKRLADGQGDLFGG